MKKELNVDFKEDDAVNARDTVHAFKVVNYYKPDDDLLAYE